MVTCLYDSQHEVNVMDVLVRGSVTKEYASEVVVVDYTGTIARPLDTDS
jgi:hypothetical protein